MLELRLVGSPIGDTGKKPKVRPPRRSKALRDAAKNAKKAIQADARLDADLSRALDAIGFLSRNEIEPAPLIARISPMEAEAVTANLRKAVEWLNRFADGWHVFTGNVETENASSGPSFEAGRSGAIRLVRSRD
jgi:hypothetical protein